MNTGQRSYGSTSNDFHDDPSDRGFGRYSDNPQPSYQTAARSNGAAQLSEKISTNIFKINSNATTLDRASKQIGTAKDSVQLRDRIHSSEQSTNYLIKETAEAFHEYAQVIAAGNKPQKLMFDKIKAEFKETVTRYNKLQKEVAQKVKSSVVLNSQQKQGYGSDLINWGQSTSDEARLVEEQRREEQFAQLQAQEVAVDSDLALLQEREERIHQLEADILDINEIFRDLGTLVSEQGDVIDTIEANVEQTHGHVEAGNQQLTSASRYQRKARKKMCILAIVLVVVAAVLALIIYLSVKK